jgi:hypothetical protein
MTTMDPKTFREFKHRHTIIACGLMLGAMRRVYRDGVFLGMVDDGDPLSEFSYTVHTSEGGKSEIRFGDGWAVNEDGQVVT